MGLTTASEIDDRIPIQLTIVKIFFKMLPEFPNLILLSEGRNGSLLRERPISKILSSSLLRTSPLAEVILLRSNNDSPPIFKVERTGFSETVIPDPWTAETESEAGDDAFACAGPFAGSWDWRHLGLGTNLETFEKYGWVIYMGSGSLVRRSVEHLLREDADVLWAPLGISMDSGRAVGILNAGEKAPSYRPSRPHSRPWRSIASSGVWAVRACYFHQLLEQWRSLLRNLYPGGPVNSTGKNLCVEVAWNRFLMDTPLRVQRFEKEEVQFPSSHTSDFLVWKDACIVNVGGWPQDAQSSFLQAWFLGTFFGDETGLFIDMIDP